MVIRCERCSTLYELDEALLSPAGSQVQCTRCQHVFTAFPARAPGRTLVGVPAQPAPAPSRPERPVSSSAGPRTPSPGGPAAAAAVARHETPRPARSGPAPVYRPTAGVASPTAGRAPILKRDTVGAFENRLRWMARWRWLAPILAVAVLLGGAAAWLFLGNRAEPEASRARTEAMALLALDDGASLEGAITRLDAILRRTPRDPVAASDRALAYVLRAEALVEEGERLAVRLAARTAERERLRREQPGGWEDAERAAASDIQRLEGVVKAHEERARVLGGAALQSLRRMQSEQGDSPELARGMAAYWALGGERERARTAIRTAREKAPADPWLELVEGWVDARDPDRAARERALARLGKLSAAHPGLFRARYLLARTQEALGRHGEAIATMDALLAANGRHEAARRLREELTVPSEPIPPAAPPDATPAPQAKTLVTRTPPPASPLPAAAPRPLAPSASERQDVRPAPRRTSAPAAAPVPSAESPPEPFDPPRTSADAPGAPDPAAAAPAPSPPAAPAGAAAPEAAAPERGRDEAPPVQTDGR